MGSEVEAMQMWWNRSGSKEEIVGHAGRRVYTIGASQVVSRNDTSAREIHDTNQKAPERVHYMKHKSQRTGKERGNWERGGRGAGLERGCRSDQRERRFVGIKRKKGRKRRYYHIVGDVHDLTG